MKTTNLFLSVLILTLLAGCKKTETTIIDPPGQSAYYIYENNTSEKVTVLGYGKTSTSQYPEIIEVITINPGDKKEFHYNAPGMADIGRPFDGKAQYCNIYYGTQTAITGNFDLTNPSKYIESYILTPGTSSGKSLAYTFAFTNEYFKDAKPITLTLEEPAYFVFLNTTEKTITIQCYGGLPGDSLKETITIESGKENIRLDVKNTFRRIESFFYYIGGNEIRISNGEKQINYKISDKASIFYKAAYQKKEIDDNRAMVEYRYVFTDNDFDNLKPTSSNAY